MAKIRLLLLAVVLATSCSLAFPQTDHEKIEIGTVLNSGIGIGSFVKPIPLPDGDWRVVSKRVEDVTIQTWSVGTRPTPRVWLTLKNDRPNPMLIAMVVSFTPDATNVHNWRSEKCEKSDPKVLTDDFGTPPDSMLVLCTRAYSRVGFKGTLAKVAESKNNWWRTNLSSLAPYMEEFPDKVLWVDLFGKKFRGASIWFSFFIKREGEVASPDYAQYVKDWMHAAGESLGKALGNDHAEFVLPVPFKPQS